MLDLGMKNHALRGLLIVSICTISRGRGQGKGVSQVQTVIDSGLYIDWGLLSGLAAKSELRELLDELYGSLS